MDLYLSSSPEIAPSRSLVIAAGGGRDLAWLHQRVAIGRAAHQLGWSSLVMPAQWQRHGRAAGPIRNRELLEQAIARAVAHTSPCSIASVLVVAFPGGPGTASLVQQARRMAARSPVPISVAQVSPSAGLWSVPAAVRP